MRSSCDEHQADGGLPELQRTRQRLNTYRRPDDADERKIRWGEWRWSRSYAVHSLCSIRRDGPEWDERRSPRYCKREKEFFGKNGGTILAGRTPERKISSMVIETRIWGWSPCRPCGIVDSRFEDAVNEEEKGRDGIQEDMCKTRDCFRVPVVVRLIRVASSSHDSNKKAAASTSKKKKEREEREESQRPGKVSGGLTRMQYIRLPPSMSESTMNILKLEQNHSPSPTCCAKIAIERQTKRALLSLFCYEAPPRMNDERRK